MQALLHINQPKPVLFFLQNPCVCFANNHDPEKRFHLATNNVLYLINRAGNREIDEIESKLTGAS
jgi:hypothetical protein